MKKLFLVIALMAVALSGCAEIVGSAYRTAITSHTAGDCGGLKGKTFDEVQARLELKAETIDDVQGGGQKAVFKKGNLEAEIAFDESGKVASTLCGDIDLLRKQRLAKQVSNKN